MIRTLIIFLPFFTSVIWFVVHRLFCSRSDSNHTLAALFAVLSLFLFYDCCYADFSAPNDIHVLSIIIAQFATPSIVPLIIIYLRKLRGTSTRHPLQMLWIIAPVALLTSSLLLLFICGIDNVGYALKEYYANGWRSLEEYRGTPLYLFFVSTFGAYRVVNYAEIVWLFLYLIVYKIKGRFKLKTLLSFFFKNGEARVCQVQLFASTVVFISLAAKTPVLKEIVNTNSWLMAIFAVIVTVFIFFFAYIALFAPKETIRWSELGDGWIYNFNDSNKKEVYGRIVDTMLDDAEEEAIERIREKIGDNLHIDDWKAGLDIPETRAINQSIFNAISESWEEDSLMAKFQKLMMNEQLFLQPSLTLGDVAEQLGTNKTYVSKLVNNAYNMGFPELINTLRVDYAEQYILAHRDAIQSEVAVKCGFLSASAFNNIFKKVTGVTPNIWKANIERSEHQAARK